MSVAHREWRPSQGTKTGRVWEIADELERKFGRPPKVSEVASAYVAEGGHPGTGTVQFYAWRNARRGSPPAAAPASGEPPPPGHDSSDWLVISPDGHLILSSELRQAMRLDASGKVHVKVVDGELRIASVPVVIERLQAMARKFDKGEGSMVDELIHDRRTEAESE